MLSGWEFLTGLITLAIILAIAIYDLGVWCIFGQDATISCSVRRMQQKWPLLGPFVAFVMGAIYGHIFL